jgi:hypothetical protein
MIAASIGIVTIAAVAIQFNRSMLRGPALRIAAYLIAWARWDEAREREQHDLRVWLERKRLAEMMKALAEVGA